jgi:hypothetical protein
MFPKIGFPFFILFGEPTRTCHLARRLLLVDGGRQVQAVAPADEFAATGGPVAPSPLALRHEHLHFRLPARDRDARAARRKWPGAPKQTVIVLRVGFSPAAKE